MANSYTWTALPTTGSASFETTIRAIFEVWRTNCNSIDAELTNARGGESDLETLVDSKAESTHTHGGGDPVSITIATNGGALSSGTTDGQIGVAQDTGASYRWDDDNSVWVMVTLGYTAIHTGAATLTSGNFALANTTSSAFTLTLPASPTVGDMIGFKDYAGTWHTNNLTVGRNGKKIESSEEDLTCRWQYGKFVLLYVNSTVGWIVI